MDDSSGKEPVLLVPPHLTASSYATLLSLDYVPRKWHLEGRHGSRTHKVEGTGKIGLPLSKLQGKIDLMKTLLKERNNLSSSTKDKVEKIIGNTKDCSLKELLFTPGVELIFKEPVISNKIPKKEPFDATIHVERMRQCFPSKFRNFIIKQKMNEMIDDTSPPKKQRKSPHEPAFTFCELFAGIGGFGLALEALGGKCVFASEIYEPSKRLYYANLDTSLLPDGKISGDIWEIDSKNIPKHDLLVAGFPCQPFSTLGTQPGLTDVKNVSGRRKGVVEDIEGGGGRGQLFTQIVRVLRDVQPRSFLLENVPGLLSTDKGSAIKTIKSALEDVGYSVSFEVCSSRGITAQSRKRLYIVGIKKNRLSTVKSQQQVTPFEFPFIPDLQLRSADVLHTDSELEKSFAETGIPEGLLRDCNLITMYCPASLFRLTDAQMDQLQKRSKFWKPAHLCWGDTSCDTIDSHYGVTVGKGNSQLVPSAAPHHPRRFTPRECCRIMGFKNSFVLGKYHKKEGFRKPKENEEDALAIFNGFIKEQYYMLGNAVCPPVIAILAGAILDVIGIKARDDEDKTDWVEKGLWAGIKLSFDAISPTSRQEVLDRLGNQHFTSNDTN